MKGLSTDTTRVSGISNEVLGAGIYDLVERSIYRRCFGVV
jgi:hypothetical protein